MVQRYKLREDITRYKRGAAYGWWRVGERLDNPLHPVKHLSFRFLWRKSEGWRDLSQTILCAKWNCNRQDSKYLVTRFCPRRSVLLPSLGRTFAPARAKTCLNWGEILPVKGTNAVGHLLMGYEYSFYSIARACAPAHACNCVHVYN